MAKGRQGIRTDDEVRAKIIELAIATDDSAANIARMIRADHRQLAPRLPGIRAMQGIVREARTIDVSGPWTLLNAEPDDLPLVLPVIADVLESELPYRPLTRKAASVAARIRRVAPDLSNLTCYLIAREVAARPAVNATRDVEDFLAFAPWRDGGDRYARAFAARRIEKFRNFLGSEITPEAMDFAVGITGGTR